ncbi:hypothetical protein K458DRAFT_445192 [Lentithecium fluviatile CBS 122367]|uniref:Peptidase A1 domain-containing protein n=1 Tax=Lentithecium fluviatile CBS 122367 TaxID=1168545 RepID=A0A6G1IR65_9PLEO|nr:hypothetical protein K458DRAFT_445192 [Lentithecium fluviatile CBS 122367]
MYITDLTVGSPPQFFRAVVHRYGVYTWGHLSRDTIGRGNISVAAQDFQEAASWHALYLIDWDEQYDSALGLARFKGANGYDDFREYGPPESLRRKSNNALHFSLPDYIAVLPNSYTHMMFPRWIADKIALHLNWTDWLDDFPYSEHRNFPDLTFNLGPQEHEFVRSPWQYMHEVVDPEGKMRCTLPFNTLYDTDEHPDYILLGNAFMASWYLDFDLEKETIGFAQRAD